MPVPALPPRSSKRILGVGVYAPGGLAFEVTALADVGARAGGGTAAFPGHAAVGSRFQGRDFGSPYRLGRAYEVRRGRRRIVAAKAARPGE